MAWIEGGTFLMGSDAGYPEEAPVTYRPAARMAQPVDTSTCHPGFRCVVRSRSPPGE
jgi:formylglycine-generating enzyme required for sulfatase activity